MIELGISTFGETTALEASGTALSHGQRLRNLLEEVQLADKLGLDVFAIGEHHRADFAVSAPEMVLAAAAGVTKQIHLSSAVTILSSQDPVRVYQQFATLDALSSGRAEVMVGRGSFTESFPLFGYDLADYEDLFDEKFAMFKAINDQEIVHWLGTKHTQALGGLGVYPRAEGGLPISVATGGNPESTIKIASQGLPIVYAIIGGNPLDFKPLIQLYKKIGQQTGQDLTKMKVAAHSWGYLADTDQEAVESYYHPTKQLVDTISKDRPFWTPLTREAYRHMVGPQGPMLVGSPQTVAMKIIRLIEYLELDRFLLHLPVGSMPHEDTLKAIDLYATQVAPVVREYFKSEKRK